MDVKTGVRHSTGDTAGQEPRFSFSLRLFSPHQHALLYPCSSPHIPYFFLSMKGSDLGKAAFVKHKQTKDQNRQGQKQSRPQILSQKSLLLEVTGSRVGRLTWFSLDWYKS